jgi:hypothetical protein
MTKNKGWRPESITPEVLTKLEAGFMNSLTDEECCLYCNIAPKTLYRYIEKNPAFWQRKELLKQKPNIKAKINKIKAINEWNTQESWWWLERKSKNEFSLKTEVEQNTNMDLKIEAKAIDSLNTLLWSD